jgi:hypothetical protein
MWQFKNSKMSATLGLPNAVTESIQYCQQSKTIDEKSITDWQQEL